MYVHNLLSFKQKKTLVFYLKPQSYSCLYPPVCRYSIYLYKKINYIRPQPLKKKSVFMFESVNNLHVVNTSRL